MGIPGIRRLVHSIATNGIARAFEMTHCHANQDSHRHQFHSTEHNEKEEYFPAAIVESVYLPDRSSRLDWIGADRRTRNCNITAT